jgi:hypothetical protein
MSAAHTPGPWAVNPELYEALDEALGLILDAYQLQTYDAEAVKRLEAVLAKAKERAA